MQFTQSDFVGSTFVSHHIFALLGVDDATQRKSSLSDRMLILLGDRLSGEDANHILTEARRLYLAGHREVEDFFEHFADALAEFERERGKA